MDPSGENLKISQLFLIFRSLMSSEGTPGMSDVSLLSGISGLSFGSTVLSPLPTPAAVSVLSFFSANGPFSWLSFPPRKFFSIFR